MVGGSGVRAFGVVLDNPSRSYFAGQVIMGRLILDLERERKTSGIKLNFVGRADVKWTESYTENTGSGAVQHRRWTTRTRTISDREIYFDHKIYVVGRSGGPDLQILPGRQEFPISFQLPLGIPSSFKGKYGNVQYTVSATLKKSCGFDKTTTTPFTVNGLADLNTTPIANSGVRFTKDKHLGCLCCKDGPISFVFQMTRSGFVPGEGLDFVVEMNNQSSKAIPRMVVRLKRNVSFRAHGKSKREQDVVTAFIGPGVPAYETEIWRSDSTTARIPAIPPTNLGGCRIIKVRYSLHVEMEIPSGFNLKGSADIIIGTIPFRYAFQQIRPAFPEPSPLPLPNTFPTTPPLIEGYPDLPLPSYQDAFIGELPTYEEACAADQPDGGGGPEGGEDKKRKEIPFDPNFVPKYATYGWMSTPTVP